MSANDFSQNLTSRSRWSALFEVCGVYMGGMLLSYLLISLLGVEIRNPLEVLKANPNADLLLAAKDLAILLFVQYAGVMFLAFAINRWRAGWRRSAYGLTLAQRPLRYHLLAGLTLFCLSELPTRLLALSRNWLALGPGSEMQEFIFNLPAWDWKFWIFMAVGSFAVVPVVEELFYRGYVQSRLEDGAGAPSAILMTAAFFTFSHSQYYFDPSALTLATLLGILFSSLVWGYVFYQTRSLVAVLVAHVLINIPMRGAAEWIIPLLMAAVVILYRRPIVRHARQCWQIFQPELRSPRLFLGAIAMAAFAFGVALSMELMLLVGTALLLAALMLEALDRRARKIDHGRETTAAPVDLPQTGS